MQEIIPLHVDGTPWRGQQDAICWDYSKKVVGREAGLEGQGTSSMLAIPDPIISALHDGPQKESTPCLNF